MSIIEKLEEGILFSRFKNKDKEAFMRAYDLYADKIYRFVYFKMGDSEDAADVTSTVFLKAWNYIQNGNLTDHKTLKSLFYRIARNCIIDHYRASVAKSHASLDQLKNFDGENEIDFKDERQELAKKIEITFDLSVVEKKLLELKDEYREIVILRFINELSIEEIAEILNKPNGGVRVLIHRALKALREVMEKDNK